MDRSRSAPRRRAWSRSRGGERDIARLVDRLSVKLGRGAGAAAEGAREPFARAGERVGGAALDDRPSPQPPPARRERERSRAAAPARPAGGDRGDLCDPRRACRGGSCGGGRCTTSRGSRGPSGSRPNGGGRRRRRGCAIITGSRIRPAAASGFTARADRRRPRRGAGLVSARAVWLMPEYTNFARKKLVRDGPVEAIPRGAVRRAWSDQPVLLPARRVGRDRAGAGGARARHGRDRHRRPQQPRRGGADAQRGQGRGAAGR